MQLDDWIMEKTENKADQRKGILAYVYKTAEDHLPLNSKSLGMPELLVGWWVASPALQRMQNSSDCGG